MSDDHAALLAAVGHMPETLDSRIDLPLSEQVLRLMRWGCSPRPDSFTRSVPVRADDHDILITSALSRLVHRVERAEADADRLAEALRYFVDSADPDDPDAGAITGSVALAAHDEAVAQR